MIIRIAITTLAALALAACTEAPQSAPKKVSTPAWQGAQNAYVEPGWKAGDAKSWETQMRTRAQAQNEYARIGGTN